MATAKKAVKKSATKRPRRRLLRKALPRSPWRRRPAKKAPPKSAKKPWRRSLQEGGEEGREEGACEEDSGEEGPCEEDRQEGQIAVRQKFIGEMKARLEEERAKYLHSEETYRAEADALIEGREPGDVQFDEESGEGDTLAVEREARPCAVQPGAPSRRADRRRTRPHQGRYVRHLCRLREVDPSRAPPCDPVGRRARRVQGWRTRQPSLSRLGPTRPT